MASKGSGRAKSSKGRRLARASKRGARHGLKPTRPLQNSQALESKSIVSIQTNAKCNLDCRELQDSQDFMESKAGNVLQDSKSAYKSQKNQGITESSMQLESGDAQGIANDKESQNPPCAPIYTESNIKSSHRAGLESKIPQSIQASQDKDSKKKQLKSEDLQSIAAREEKKNQTSRPTKVQAIMESKTKSSLDFQTIQSPQTAATYTESKESQMQIPFEILGFDSHSTLQLVSLQAARHGISLFASKEGGILLAKGHSYGLDGFFAEVSALFGEKLLKGELASFLVEKLAAAALSLCVAESCTGGLISSIITGVPGASRIYKGGVVTYSATSKQKILGVRESTIKECGVYSQKCVMEMARGALDLFGADIAIATSGLASSDTSADNFLKLPPGLVFTCVLRRGHLPIATEQHHLKGGMESNLDSRHLVQKQASLEAIRLVFEALRA